MPIRIMLRRCPLPFVEGISTCRHTGTFRYHIPPHTSWVIVEHLRSNVVRKNRWKQIPRATQSFLDALEERDTEFYFQSLVVAEIDGSSERAELAICSALRSEDLELQNKAAQALLSLSAGDTGGWDQGIEALAVLSHNYDGLLFSDTMDLHYAGACDVARELALMVIANRILETQVDAPSLTDEVRKGLEEVKLGAEDFVSDRRLSYNATQFIMTVRAYAALEMSRHVLSTSVVSALAEIVMRDNIDVETCGDVQLTLLSTSMGALSNALCNPAVDSRKLASSLVHAGVLEKMLLLLPSQEMIVGQPASILLWHVLRSLPSAILEEKKELIERGVPALLRVAGWSSVWYEEEVEAARLCAFNTLKLLTTVCNQGSFAEQLVHLGVIPMLLDHCNDIWAPDGSNRSHFRLCDGCDEHAVLRLLTFLARHHPRPQGDVVCEIRRSLGKVCNLLGAGQEPDSEAAVLELLKALGPQHRGEIYNQLMTAHAEGTFNHGMCGNPAAWTAWWAHVSEALQLDEVQNPTPG